MRKFKSFANFDKEEAWLKTMAEQGWLLVSTSFGYEFVPGAAQELTYRVDYRTFRRKMDFADYVSLFEDGGWHHVSGSFWSGTQYFVRLRPDVADDIFSDDASKAARYRRSSELWLMLFLCYAALLLVSFMINGGSDFPFLHLQDLYYTPGLWEKTGFEFWRAFLFETPFALGRAFSGSLLVIVTGVFAYQAIRTFLAGRRTRYESVL